MQVSVTKEKPERMLGGGRGQTGGQVQTTSAFPWTRQGLGILFQMSRGAIDILGDAF